MYKFKLFLAALALVSTSLFAQENSPYGRYGIGLSQQSENIANRGMGGTSIADRNYRLINTENPASYTGLNTLQLTAYQIGLNGSLFNIRSQSESNRTGGFGLSYVNFAFPITKNTTMSFGLLPHSRVNYSMQANDSVKDVSRVIYDYFGSGSIQKVYLGAAHQYKGFSFGFNAAYLFGSYQNNLSERFTDSLQILEAYSLKRTRLSGITWDLGAQYHHIIKEDYFLNVGATFSSQANINAKVDQDWYASIGFPDNTSPYSYLVDSIRDFAGTVALPSQLGFGIMVGNGDYWKAGIDYKRANWSNYRSYGRADSFVNATTLRLGGEFTPDINDKFNAWKTITYRAGAYYIKEPLKLNNTQITSRALTLGLGYPIKRTYLSLGQFNAGLEIGARGTLDAGLVQENYTRFSIGVTLNDRWFIKRLYD